MDAVSSDCPLSTRSSAKEGMSGGGKFGVVFLVFSVVGLAGWFLVVRKRKRSAKAFDSSGDDEPSSDEEDEAEDY
jgi:hypothetical protein